MTGGAGHIADMIARMRVNESAMRRKRFYFSKVKNEYIRALREENIDYQRATPDQILAVREKIARHRKSEIRRMWMVLSVTALVSVVVLAISWWLFRLFW